MDYEKENIRVIFGRNHGGFTGSLRRRKGPEKQVEPGLGLCYNK